MSEEFEESDILWPEADDEGAAKAKPAWSEERPPRRQPLAARALVSRSWAPSSAYGSNLCDDVGDDEGKRRSRGSRPIIPPHVIVAQRNRGGDGAECSVLVGNGRKLAGWDLRRFRTFVLRMTGYVEGSAHK
ncbi:protein S40-1-like [Curcuma longa]|uniref:protein S40-1-like n=1 Tax=Curcuma longa TaxID=136217 RepID=UPI003D9DFFC6